MEWAAGVAQEREQVQEPVPSVLAQVQERVQAQEDDEPRAALMLGRAEEEERR